MTTGALFPDHKNVRHIRRGRSLWDRFSRRDVANLNTAHFPGTGPKGATCISCRFAALGDDPGDDKANLGRCNKVRVLTSRDPGKISLRLSACRHYERKEGWPG